jgi:hypothetical protein
MASWGLDSLPMAVLAQIADYLPISSVFLPPLFLPYHRFAFGSESKIPLLEVSKWGSSSLVLGS